VSDAAQAALVWTRKSEPSAAVTSSRAFESVVYEIRSQIRTERLTPGDRLPSERELCARMGVSRVTVREAMRVLEAIGLIVIKVGKGGGAFITSPSSTRIGEALADFICVGPPTAVEVTEARRVFEVGIVPMVIERATDDDVADLRAMVVEHQAAYQNGSYGMPMSAAFHVRVAACTHNTAIEALVRSFHGPVLTHLRGAGPPPRRIGQSGAGAHWDVVRAIAARDLAGCMASMSAHLSRTARPWNAPALEPLDTSADHPNALASMAIPALDENFVRRRDSRR
jgi:GntR family transcriptional repressor for pyruvate dehydrogenase complex